MQIAGVGCALPEHDYSQGELIAALASAWGPRFRHTRRAQQLQRAVGVNRRRLTLPIDAYPKLEGFEQTNDAWVRCATALGERALRDSLERAGLEPRDVSHLLFASTTGIAVPSIDARLIDLLGIPAHVRRTPIFGLGCAAGAVGLSRAADHVRAYPGETAALLCVELCSLTLQKRDTSVANLIAAGLFGDGAAAVVVTDDPRAHPGPRVVASRSIFFPNTEHVMGWRLTDSGFGIVLSADVPRIAGSLAPHIDCFLGEHDLRRSDVDHFVCHPGGPKVLTALQEGLGLEPDALRVTWQCLAEMGNLSSASVLFVLRRTLELPIEPGRVGLLLALGPGFSAEFVLLRW